jgi:cytochrome P450
MNHQLDQKVVLLSFPSKVFAVAFRYGPIFRTNLVGRPVVVSTDPDLNYFIFQQEGQLFQSWYPDTFTEIFGRQNVGSLHGFMYKYLKNMVLNLFGPESLKKMLPEVEQTTSKRLQLWSHQESVELKETTATVISYYPSSHNGSHQKLFILNLITILIFTDDIRSDSKEAHKL